GAPAESGRISPGWPFWLLSGHTNVRAAYPTWYVGIVKTGGAGRCPRQNPSRNEIGSPTTLYFLYCRPNCTNTCTMANSHDGPPAAQGLYDPHAEHDACGVGFVVHIKGQRSHTIIRKALQVLINLEHRGACGCEVNTGDGAGILIQVPDAFLRKVVSFTVPPAGAYGVGLVFLPHDAPDREAIRQLITRIVDEENAEVLGWRDVPTDNGLLGAGAVAAQPVFQQLFIGSKGTASSRSGGHESALSGPDARTRFECKLYVIRKRIEHEADRLEMSA